MKKDIPDQKKNKDSVLRDNPGDCPSQSHKDDFDLGESFEILTGHGGVKKLFLRRFTDKELYHIMNRIGLKTHLEKAGFKNLLIDISVDDARINYFKLYSGEKSIENQLVDIRVSENQFMPGSRYFPEGTEIIPYEMINIEWLSARNPRRHEFDEKRPQLPGQTNPGLGILKYCFNLLHLLAEEICKDGFLDIPDHMHGAIMYSRKFKFFDPVHEAIIRAVIRDLRNYSISDISWGIITGAIIERYSGKPQVYDPCEQVHYVSRRLKKYFHSDKYLSTYKKYYERKKYCFDYEEMLRRREEILSTRKIEDL